MYVLAAVTSSRRIFEGPLDIPLKRLEGNRPPHKRSCVRRLRFQSLQTALERGNPSFHKTQQRRSTTIVHHIPLGAMFQPAAGAGGEELDARRALEGLRKQLLRVRRLQGRGIERFEQHPHLSAQRKPRADRACFALLLNHELQPMHALPFHVEAQVAFQLDLCGSTAGMAKNRTANLDPRESPRYVDEPHARLVDRDRIQMQQ